MWSFRVEQLPYRRGMHFALDLDSKPASFADVLGAWQNDPGFRSLFNAQLADIPYKAFRWETPPVTDTTVSRPFEFVLLDSPGLALLPDPEPFTGHFGAASEEGVVVFPNLGRDAIMVVPCPLTSPSAYGHLAAFVREAPRRNGTPSGDRLARRWLDGSELSQCGSALPGAVYRGSTCVSTIGRSITATGRIGKTLRRPGV